MTSVVNPLPIPKPKRFAPREKSPFFPLAFSSTSSSSSASSVVWRHFTGYLIGKWIAVFHRGDAEILAKANFGKGALSKFRLTFDGRDWKPSLPTESGSRHHPAASHEHPDDPRFEGSDWAEFGDEQMEDREIREEPTVHLPQASAPEAYQEMKFQMSRRRFEKHQRWRRDISNGIEERMGEEREGDEGARDETVDRCGGESQLAAVENDEPERKRARVCDGGEGSNTEERRGASHGSIGSSDLSGDFVIYEDTDSEGEGWEEEEQRLQLQRADGKDVALGSARPRRMLFSSHGDPLPLNECLLLSFEEAFFLSYGLGCLTVMSSSPLDSLPLNRISTNSTSSSLSTPLPLLDLWRRFRGADPRFPSKYVAYHFYRSRGWVPRCGLKFGVDFLLYVYGPRDYHATFSLQVQEVDHRLRQIAPSRESTTATSASALSRVTEQVNKDLLICYVVRPKTKSITKESTKGSSAVNKLAGRTFKDVIQQTVKTAAAQPTLTAAAATAPTRPSHGAALPTIVNSPPEEKPLKDLYSRSVDELESLLDSPNCVKHFRVKEVLKKRWMMDTERDQTKGLLLSMK